MLQRSQGVITARNSSFSTDRVESASSDALTQAIRDLVVVLTFLTALGFPGKFADVYFRSLTPLLDYGTFIAQILVMVLSSGKDFLDYRIFHLYREDAAIYVYITYVFVSSMLVTNYPKEQLISCIRLIVTAVFAIWITKQYKPKEILRLFCYAQTVIVWDDRIHADTAVFGFRF